MNVLRLWGFVRFFVIIFVGFFDSSFDIWSLVILVTSVLLQDQIHHPNYEYDRSKSSD